ncbi:MAG: hypothetical protein GY866_43315 [Proteobacteria bacterium]|nr:hypothetical protein [Pseudomonadota bacterium]
MKQGVVGYLQAGTVVWLAENSFGGSGHDRVRKQCFQYHKTAFAGRCGHLFDKRFEFRLAVHGMGCQGIVVRFDIDVRPTAFYQLDILDNAFRGFFDYQRSHGVGRLQSRYSFGVWRQKFAPVSRPGADVEKR